MARVTPPTITPVPTPPIQRGDRTTFSSRVDAFILWLVGAVTQFQALATNAYNNALDAFDSATNASTSATNAGNSATTANTRAGAANTSANNAADSATAAAGSAQAASNSASAAASSVTGLTATSTSSNTVTTGAKTFTVQASKQFVAGVDIKVVDASNAANAIYGTITSYSGTTLVIAGASVTGSGTVANWNISVVGKTGSQGVVGPAGGSGPTFNKGNSGTTAQVVDYNDGEGQTLTATGAFSLSATGFPAGRLSAVVLRLINGGANGFSSTGINWIKSDGSFTTTFSQAGITLQASGTDLVLLLSYGDGAVYAKVAR